jgi:AsmA-like C-terminal region/AsmA family
MRKTAKVLAILIIVLVLAVVLVPRLVSIESFKPRIVAALAEKTGGSIGLDRISLALFPGIGVKISGLTVSADARHPKERLLEVPEGEVRVAILPLLSGRFEFTKVILRRPKILFRKYADGTHSATQIVARLAGKGTPGASTPPSASERKVSIALRSVSIEEADLSLRIEGPGGKTTRWDLSPFAFRLAAIGGSKNEFTIGTRIEGAVRGEISLSGTVSHGAGAGSAPTAYDLRGAGTLFGQKVEMNGKISMPKGPAAVDLAVSFPGIEMGKLSSILKDPPPALRDARLEGAGGLVLKTEGTLQSLGFTADADLTRAGWTLSRDPEVRKPIGAACKLSVRGRLGSDRLVISRAELSIPPLLLSGNGSMVLSTGEREWSVTSRVSSLADLAKIRGAGLSAYSPAGRMTASATGKRPRSGAGERYSVAADLGEVGFTLPGRGIRLRSMNGHLDLTPGTVKCKPLTGLVNGQRFSLRGEMSRGPAPRGTVDLTMAYLDADALFPPGGGEAAASKDGTGKKAGRTAGGEAGGAYSVRVKLAIAAGKARGVEFQDLRGTARYERRTLFLDAVRTRLYGGEALVTGRIGLGGPSPALQAKVDLKKVRAGEILSRKTSLGDLVSGSVNLTADLGGGIRDFSEFTRTAAGSGSLRVSGGTIKGMDLAWTAIGLAGLSRLLPELLAGGGGGKGKETPFKDLSADFRIEGGRIRTEALRIVSEKMGLSGKASLGFDRTIDFQGVLRLSNELSGQVGREAGKFLRGNHGEVEIPLILSGPVTGPRISIDAAALAKGAARKFLRELTEPLRPEAAPAPGDNAAAGGATGTTKPPGPKQELDNLFKKLLPGK